MSGFVLCPCCKSRIPVTKDDIGLSVRCLKSCRMIRVQSSDVRTNPPPATPAAHRPVANPVPLRPVASPARNPVPVPRDVPFDAPETERRGGSGKLIAFGVGALVLVLAGVAGFAYVQMKKPEPETASVPKPAPANVPTPPAPNPVVEPTPSTVSTAKPEVPTPVQPVVDPKPVVVATVKPEVAPVKPEVAPEPRLFVATLPGLTHLSPIYRVFPADIVKPLYLPDPTAFPNEINRKIWDFCQGQLGLKVGNGQCAAINHEAIKFATGSFPSIKGPDYVWGTLIATIAPGKADGVAKIQPGDLMQFRQAQFSGSYKKNGTTWTWRSMAGHADGSIGHSAVVRAVADGGYLLNTFEQNLSDIQIEMKGFYNLRELTAGTIWIYRAK